MRSIRRELLGGLLLGLALLVAVVGGTLRVTLADALTEQYDRGLLARAESVALPLELHELEGDDGPEIEYDFQADAMPSFVGGPHAEYFDLWLADGEEYGRSPSLGLENQMPPAFPATSTPRYRDLALPDGRPGRAVEITVPVGFDDDGPDLPEELLPRMTCVVASTRADLDAQLASLDLRLALAGAGVLALAALVVLWAVRRGLAPLRRLDRQVAAVDAAHLDARIDVEGAPAELTETTTRLNELLARLEDAFAKERRMTAAMAHELRTPIAELRSASDVARRWPDDAELSRELADTAHDVALRMSEAVEAIMHCCRIEAGQERPQVERIPLRDLLDELWRPHGDAADARGLAFRNEVPDDAVAVTDRGLLGLALGNVLSNAASFADGGEVRARVEQNGAGPELSVSNEARHLVDDDLARMAEPFWRKDAARTVGRHSGLGLTLVTSLTTALGCRARLGLEQGRFVVRVGIPGGD